MNEELKKQLIQNIEDQRGELDDIEIDDTILLIQDLPLGEKLSSIDVSLIQRMIQNEDDDGTLYNKVQALEQSKEEDPF